MPLGTQHGDVTVSLTQLANLYFNQGRYDEAVALIDVAVPVPSTRVVLVKLEHIDAPEAAGTLTQLIRSSPTLWRAGPRDPMPSVVSHNQTNSLVISATERHLEAIKALIEQMDQRPK